MGCSPPRAMWRTAKGSCASTRASTCTRRRRPTRPAPTCATRPAGRQVGGPRGPLGPHRYQEHRPADPA
eukprot:195284-Alexandrium_andersonii.AAC.1